jgi:hypothetical protein
MTPALSGVLEEGLCVVLARAFVIASSRALSLGNDTESSARFSSCFCITFFRVDGIMG